MHLHHLTFKSKSLKLLLKIQQISKMESEHKIKTFFKAIALYLIYIFTTMSAFNVVSFEAIY